MEDLDDPQVVIQACMCSMRNWRGRGRSAALRTLQACLFLLRSLGLAIIIIRVIKVIKKCMARLRMIYIFNLQALLLPKLR
jgi:hypothetical protein